jgi:hypothetical protein
VGSAGRRDLRAKDAYAAGRRQTVGEALVNLANGSEPLYETGALLPGPDATLAGPTFEEWLDSTS